MRRALLRILRATHLIQFADRFAAWRAASKLAALNASYRAAHPQRVFPDPALVFETSGHAALVVFDESGADYAQRIAALLNEAALPPNPRILDWGAGAGRILAHLPAAFETPAQLHGCDPNPRAVAHVRRALPYVAMAQSQDLPPAPYSDASFDAIYGVSILTHLSESAARAWIGELARLIADAGVVIVTTHGERAAQRLASTHRTAFEAGAFVELGGARIGSRTYLSYFNEAAGRALFSASFGDIAFHPSPSDDFNQDIWVLRAPRRSAPA